jgi:hypothetical protein
MGLFDSFSTKLSSKDSQRIILESVMSALKSDHGRAAVRRSFAEADARPELESALRDALSELRSELLSEIAIARSDASRTFGRELENLAANNLNALKHRAEAIEKTLSTRIEHAVDDKIKDCALSLVISAVNKHIRRNPVAYPNWTNRQIASANGVSVREVKRRRRAGLL